MKQLVKFISCYIFIEILNDWEFDLEQAIPMLSVIFTANDIYAKGVAKHK